MSYYISKNLNLSFEDSERKVIEALKEEGFGIVSEINIDEKIKEKLGVDFRRYKILGACNPPIALKALKLEDKIGTMLPCNIILQEIDSGGTEISAVDPIASMQAIQNEKLGDIANEVKQKLERVMKSLKD